MPSEKKKNLGGGGAKKDSDGIRVLLYTMVYSEQFLFPFPLKKRCFEDFSFKEVLRMERSSSTPDRFSFLGTLVRTLRATQTCLPKAGLIPAGSNFRLVTFLTHCSPFRWPATTFKNPQTPFPENEGKVSLIPSRLSPCWPKNGRSGLHFVTGWQN